MAIKGLDADNLNYEQKLKKYKRKRTVIIILIVLVLAGIFLFAVNKIFVKNYNSYEVISSTERADSNTVVYERYGKNLLKFSRDGASALEGTSGLLWNGSYNMKSPQADVCGEYAVIADIGGKELAVFDGKGNKGVLTLTDNIITAKVAKQGVVAVLLESTGDTYKIEVHNPFQGGDTRLFDERISAISNGFAVDLDISEDGTILVICLLKVENGQTYSDVAYFNLTEAALSTNYVMGGINYQTTKTIVPKAEFINANTVAVYGDNLIEIHTVKKVIQQSFQIPIETEVKSVFSNDKYVGYITDNYDQDEDGKYKLMLYNMSGQKVLEQPIDYNYRQIVMGNEEIIFLSDYECTILKTNGNVKFQGKFDNKVSFIMPVDNFNKYYIVDELNIEKIKLVETKSN